MPTWSRQQARRLASDSWQTSASFQHRHAVTVFDAGEDDGDLYIVMELVDGPSLAEQLGRTGPLPIGEVLRIGGQVLAALAAAHDVGIVHRDVKPANILLAPDGDAKLADFGIAKRLDELEGSVTHSGTVIGTPRYLAPEQATGAPVTPSTDVYAMGIVLFEMLTGRTPFTGDSAVATALAQQLQAPPDVRALRPEASEALAATVARALARDPSQRYSTAREMAAELGSAWSPPPPALPESAILTQAMTLADAAVPETQAVRVNRAVSARSGHTQVLPMATAQPPALPVRSTRRRPQSALWITTAIVVFVVLIAVAVAVTSRSGVNGAVDVPEAAQSTPVTTPALVTTVPPSTDQPIAEPIAELIPGFAQTDDLEVFVQQLEQDPSVVGTAGSALAESLGRLLDEKAAPKQRSMAKELTGQLGKWAEAGELNPAVAQALSQLLAPLADKAK